MVARRVDSTMARDTLTRARVRTDALFNLVRPDAFYERPVPERHRIVFYVGHLEAFDWNLLSQAVGEAPFHPEFDRLFAFGIDPEPGQLPQDQPSDWPGREEIRQYILCVRQATDDVANRISPQLLSVAIEHRLMHAETFAYLLHQLALPYKAIPSVTHHSCGQSPRPEVIEIPAGTATLGRSRTHQTSPSHFGWDNEFNGHEVSVPAFAISKYKVTNGEYLDFVRDGAMPPHFWKRCEGRWLWRTMAGEVPLPLDWPVYVTQGEATAFVTWAGKRLPTEAEFHRVAYGTPLGEEQRFYPWGDDQPDPRRGNFGESRWDPVPVTATPLGDSAFGVAQLVGNGWEWTSTRFQPFPGFEPFPFYPGYSSRFFDGNHYVLKGGSARTDASLLRRSFRNWFRPNYPYVYAGFRCVET